MTKAPRCDGTRSRVRLDPIGSAGLGNTDPTLFTPPSFFLACSSARLNHTINMSASIQSAVSTVQTLLRTASQKVLLLGSGFVAKPCLDYLAKEGIQITVGMLQAECARWRRIDLADWILCSLPYSGERKETLCGCLTRHPHLS